MAPSSRETTGPEVPDERPFSPPSPRWAMVKKFPMREYSLVSPGVGYCATNEVVHSSYNSEVSAECATNSKVKI